MELDLVISGGGIKFYYLLGIKRAIEDLERKKIITFKRYSATSSGAILLPLIICKIDNRKALEVYKITQKVKTKYRIDLITIFLNQILPNNAHLLCSGKLFLSMSEIDGCHIKNKTVSNFRSKDELINFIKCSCAFPIFTHPNIYLRFKNRKYIDGCFSKNTPYFEDKIREQVIIKIFFIKYHNFNLFNLETSKHIRYYQKGYKNFISFLKGKNISCFQWGKNKNIMNNFLLYFVNFIRNRKIIFIIICLFILKKMN